MGVGREGVGGVGWGVGSQTPAVLRSPAFLIVYLSPLTVMCQYNERNSRAEHN